MIIHERPGTPDRSLTAPKLDRQIAGMFTACGFPNPERADDERAAIKQRFATEPAIAGAPRRIETICLDLIEHFTKFIAPNRFKAQVVATSRDAAVTYKETLDRLNGPESAVVMSARHNDEERLSVQERTGAGDRPVQGRQRSALDPDRVRHAADRFRRPGRAGHLGHPPA